MSDLDGGTVTPLSIEPKLLAAYRAGRQAFRDFPGMPDSTVNKKARVEFRSNQERECFVAGFQGDRARAANSNQRK